MINEIKEVWKLSISLVLMSVILAMTAYGGYVARKSIAYKIDYNARMSYIDLQSKLYKYVSGDYPISGSDMIEFITEYNTKYKYRIITDSETYSIWNNSDQHKGATKYYLELMGYKNTPLEDIPVNEYVAADSALWTQSHLTNEILKDDVYRQYKVYVTLPNEEDTQGINKGVSGTNRIEDIVDNQTFIIFNFKIIPK